MTVGPEDSLGRAAELMRVSGLSELPVVSYGQVVGVITEGSILAALLEESGGSAIERAVGSITLDPPACINAYLPIHVAAEIMKDHDLQEIPVVGERGQFLGVVTRSDVVGALSLAMRPPSVGGLATPLGVYLTTGQYSAGAGGLGLFLAGVALGFLRFLAVGLILVLAFIASRYTRLPLWQILTSSNVGNSNWVYIREGMLLLSIPLFALLLRLSTLSGYHAAEHQVVNAIENGEPLSTEYVKRMSRVHPRCGTNILAAAVVFMLISSAFSMDIAVLITIVVLVFGWRVIGGFLQYFVTTKPPNPKQLASGIAAGKELLARYQENPSYRVSEWRRIWNTGMPLVMLGMMAISAVMLAIIKFYPRVGDFFPM